MKGSSKEAASICLVENTKLIDFDTRKQATLDMVPRQILPFLQTNVSSNHWTFQVSLIFDGPEELAPIYAYQLQNDQNNLINTLMVKTITETVVPRRKFTGDRNYTHAYGSR